MALETVYGRTIFDGGRNCVGHASRLLYCAAVVVRYRPNNCMWWTLTARTRSLSWRVTPAGQLASWCRHCATPFSRTSVLSTLCQHWPRSVVTISPLSQSLYISHTYNTHWSSSFNALRFCWLIKLTTPFCKLMINCSFTDVCDLYYVV